MPLGVIARNENKYEELIDILNKMQKYVPASAATNRLKTCVLSGDQLTTERIHNLQKIRATSESQSARFDGFLPIHADWHAEVTYLQVRNASIYVLILYKLYNYRRRISMYTIFFFACMHYIIGLQHALSIFMSAFRQ